METSGLAIISMLAAGFFNALGGFYFKRSVTNISFSFKGLILNTTLVAGVLLYGVSCLFSVPALRFGALSVLYPFMSTSYIWVALLSSTFMGEKITIPKRIGITLIIVGVVFIGLGA